MMSRVVCRNMLAILGIYLLHLKFILQTNSSEDGSYIEFYNIRLQVKGRFKYVGKAIFCVS